MILIKIKPFDIASEYLYYADDDASFIISLMLGVEMLELSSVLVRRIILGRTKISDILRSLLHYSAPYS